MRYYSKGYWLNTVSRDFLGADGGYVLPEHTAEQRIRAIAEAAEGYLGIAGYADKLEEYILKGWVSLSSPVWANFGTNRGLPISCFNSHFEDTMDSILSKVAEIGKQTQKGGGTSAFLGNLRPRGATISTGGQSEGPAHFARLLDTTIDVISQSNVRRGQCAVYLNADHPDIMEFLSLRDIGNPVQKLSLGVSISDDWLAEMKKEEAGGPRRKVMAKIHEKRAAKGFPYFFFVDNANKAATDVYKDKGRSINASNLCTEIMLSSNEDESFVCCLSSVNVLHYHEWKHTDLIETMVYLLDAVLTEFIIKSENIPFMETARNFAINQRAIGLGVLGWHSFLQSQMLAFGSMEARQYNIEIFKLIQEQSLAASKKMASEYGEPPMLEGYGRRHVTLNAIAPTMSSSAILGQVSPSIEPYESNYFSSDIQKTTFITKNPYLKDLLASRGLDNEAVWDDILIHGGSVQHVDYLSADEKEVFKTFGEISQGDIITTAAQRQKYIDQGQSVNLMIHPDTPLRDIHNLVLKAHELGLKSLYYLKGTNKAQEYARGLTQCSVCES